MTKQTRTLGAERAQLAQDLAAQYATGLSIRQLAEAFGYSYGKIHRLLTEDAGIELRPHGGNHQLKSEFGR